MQLSLSTWPQVQDYLKRSKGCIVPIGAMEQHGPTGPIGTDAFCAEIIARELGAAVGALVTPTISVGMSVHHTAFPGTMTLRPSALQQLIQDYVLSLAYMGLERFFFVNGHGGNESSLHAAFWDFYAAAPGLPLAHARSVRLTFESWWKMPLTEKITRELFGDKEGGHATPGEISIAMYGHPECDWHVTDIPKDMTPDFKVGALGFGPVDFQQTWPDGRMNSDPTLARPEHGRRLVEACITDLRERYGRFMQ